MSDFPHLKVTRSYGGLNPQWDSTTAQRWFFLIDRQGIIRAQWRGSVSEVFPNEPILKAVREITGKR